MVVYGCVLFCMFFFCLWFFICDVVLCLCLCVSVSVCVLGCGVVSLFSVCRSVQCVCVFSVSCVFGLCCQSVVSVVLVFAWRVHGVRGVLMAWFVQVKRMIRGLGNMLFSTYSQTINGSNQQENMTHNNHASATAMNTVKTDQGITQHILFDLSINIRSYFGASRNQLCNHFVAHGIYMECRCLCHGDHFAVGKN